MTALEVALALLCGVAALVALVHLVRDVPPGRVVFSLLAVVEAGLVVVLVAGIVRLATQDTTGVSVATYLSYLVGSPLVLPVGAVWSASEPTRGGTGVLLVALVVVPVLFLRLSVIWPSS